MQLLHSIYNAICYAVEQLQNLQLRRSYDIQVQKHFGSKQAQESKLRIAKSN